MFNFFYILIHHFYFGKNNKKIEKKMFIIFAEIYSLLYRQLESVHPISLEG